MCFFPPEAVEKVASSPSDKENTNVWIGVGVVVPLLVVLLILSILYWKLCRTDKLEFQPDAMTAIQQRQKVCGRTPLYLRRSASNVLVVAIPSLFSELYRTFAVISGCPNLGFQNPVSVKNSVH